MLASGVKRVCCTDADFLRREVSFPVPLTAVSSPPSQRTSFPAGDSTLTPFPVWRPPRVSAGKGPQLDPRLGPAPLPSLPPSPTRPVTSGPTPARSRVSPCPSRALSIGSRRPRAWALPGGGPSQQEERCQLLRAPWGGHRPREGPRGCTRREPLTEPEGTPTGLVSGRAASSVGSVDRAGWQGLPRGVHALGSLGKLQSAWGRTTRARDPGPGLHTGPAGTAPAPGRPGAPALARERLFAQAQPGRAATPGSVSRACPSPKPRRLPCEARHPCRPCTTVTFSLHASDPGRDRGELESQRCLSRVPGLPHWASCPHTHPCRGRITGAVSPWSIRVVAVSQASCPCDTSVLWPHHGRRVPVVHPCCGCVTGIVSLRYVRVVAASRASCPRGSPVSWPRHGRCVPAIRPCRGQVTGVCSSEAESHSSARVPLCPVGGRWAASASWPLMDNTVVNTGEGRMTEASGAAGRALDVSAPGSPRRPAVTPLGVAPQPAVAAPASHHPEDRE
ncbi:unnamed protein product [Rangifer tarandus platyrhynchus]|uniref:Uncharacterized protein n=1 Tax=Rangifer tarandus platyrhynchus TaxID=3082113 RepID=A0ABN8Y760_RANTA|nr:unnamed protein product [Rangifer tarandus platyrhynchus]